MKALLLFALFSSLSARADLLTITPASPAVVDTGVTIAASATATVNGENYTLSEVGEALKWQQVLININIYVGQLLVSDPTVYNKTVAGALASLDNEQAVALIMDMLFSPPTSLVMQTFNKAAAANKIPTNDPDLSAMMNGIHSMSFRDGGSVTLLFAKDSTGKDWLVIEDKVNATDVTATPPIALTAQGRHKILSLWFGTPFDGGAAAFENDLMK